MYADYQGQYTDIDDITRHHVATDHAALCDETHLAANALQLKEILQNPLRLMCTIIHMLHVLYHDTLARLPYARCMLHLLLYSHRHGTLHHRHEQEHGCAVVMPRPGAACATCPCKLQSHMGHPPTNTSTISLAVSSWLHSQIST